MGRQKKSRPSIDISNSDDDLWGPLSFLDESTPFECQNKLWPSIARFVFAQKFRGTSLVQKIQEAPSNTRAMRLTKPIPYNIITSEGRVQTKYDYLVAGDVSPDTSRIAESINEAIKAKFVKQQQIQLLIRTYPAKFISPFKLYASLLGKYRDGLYISVKAPSVGQVNTVGDIPETGADDLFETLDIYVKKIKKLEGLEGSADHLGMYDDAAYNMAPPKAIANIIKIPYGVVFKTQPKYSRLINQVTDLLAKKFPKSVKSTKEFGEVVSRVAAAFRWLLIDADFETSLRYRSATHLSLRPVPRKYRKHRALGPRNDQIPKSQFHDLGPLPDLVRPVEAALTTVLSDRLDVGSNREGLGDPKSQNILTARPGRQDSGETRHPPRIDLPPIGNKINPSPRRAPFRPSTLVPTKAASTEEKSDPADLDDEEESSETTEPNSEESSESVSTEEEPETKPVRSKPRPPMQSEPLPAPQKLGRHHPEEDPQPNHPKPEKFGKKRKK